MGRFMKGTVLDYKTFDIYVHTKTARTILRPEVLNDSTSKKLDNIIFCIFFWLSEKPTEEFELGKGEVNGGREANHF